jgi:hypothetical protein
MQHVPVGAAPQQPADESGVYFACVPPDVPLGDLVQLFSMCGRIVDINLYKAYAKARVSKVGTLKAGWALQCQAHRSTNTAWMNRQLEAGTLPFAQLLAARQWQHLEPCVLHCTPHAARKGGAAQALQDCF